MEQEQVREEIQSGADVVDTKHEPHPHARPRILIGISAVVVLLLAILVWSRWGGVIQEKCFGDGEVCTVPMPEATQ